MKQNGRILVALTIAACLVGSWSCTALAGLSEVENHLKAGRAALEDGLYKVAERELERCLKKAAEGDAAVELTSEAVVLLAKLRLQQGRGNELLDFLKKNRRWIKRAAPGTADFWRGLAFYELGDSRQALKTLAKFETKFPDSEYLPRVLRLQAWCCLDQGTRKDAIDVFERYNREFPDADGAMANRLDWAKALMAGENLVEALAVLESIPADAKADILAETRLWIARVHLKENRWQDASESLSSISPDDPIDPDLRAESWFSLADAYLGTDAHEAAVGALTKGLEFARRQDLVLTGKRKLGMLKLDAAEIDAGVSLLKEFVTLAPANPLANQIQLKLSSALFANGDAEQSLAEYQYFVETFTNSAGVAEAQRGRGWALLSLARHSEAAVAFEKAFELYTTPEARIECLYKAGDALFLNEQFKQASSKYRRLIEDYPESDLVPTASFQLGESLARSGNLEAAEARYLELAAQFATHALAEEALLRVGDLRRDNGRLVGAAESYTLVMDTYSNGTCFAEAMLGRGLARYQLYRFGEALEDFGNVLTHIGDVDPHVEETRYWIAMCYYWLGKPDQAEALGKAFLAVYTNSAFTARLSFWRGKQAYNNGDFDTAEQRFVKFYEENEDHEDAESAILWAGRSAAARKDYLRANELFRKLLTEHPESDYVPDARFEQGNALVALAKYPEGILVLQEIINKHPDYDQVPETWLRIGDCQFNLGATDGNRYEAAIQAYNAASKHQDAGVDLKLHAEYKVGRCLQKLDRSEEAVAHYYTSVMIRFLDDRELGVTHNEASRMWFGRACRNIADLLEANEEWRKLVSVLERSLNVGVPDEAAIRDRIKKIRADHWWLFY